METVELTHRELRLSENKGELSFFLFLFSFYKKRHLKKYNRPLHQKPTGTIERLKYRELRLNDNNGEFIYQTKNTRTRQCYSFKCCKRSEMHRRR